MIWLKNHSLTIQPMWEDSFHYFFEFPNYSHIRCILFSDLNWLPNDYALDLKLLIWDKKYLLEVQNEAVFMVVFEFIKGSETFILLVWYHFLSSCNTSTSLTETISTITFDLLFLTFFPFVYDFILFEYFNLIG